MADLFRDALALAAVMAGCVFALAGAVRLGKWWNRQRTLSARDRQYREFLQRRYARIVREQQQLAQERRKG